MIEASACSSKFSLRLRLRLYFMPFLTILSNYNGMTAYICRRFIPTTVFGRPFVKRFALCYRTVVCPVLSVLSVTFVHCGQTVGRIKMKLGTQVGLGPSHIVLGGDPASPPIKGHSQPNFRPISVAAKWLRGSRCHLVWR